MDDFNRKQILIIDCQTTGMHPSTASLLQIAWCIFDAQSEQPPLIVKRTVQVPTNELSNKIIKMLNISEQEIENSLEPKVVFDELQSAVTRLGHEPIILAHYAQFEQSFLKQFYLEHSGTEQFNFTLLCSQKIAKRVLPHVPSHNLKALAGYFQLEDTRKNDVYSHVMMTYMVWKKLIPMLCEWDITSYAALQLWLNTKIKPHKASHYEYNIERLTRLDLPERPGVYHMIAKDGTILYVGKATSLKSRVNSYFRGVKNRDRRKLEMLAQVWDIKTTLCDTPFEAALLESDNIKTFNPPYNLLLKDDNRSIIFYDDSFNNYSDNRCAIFCNGPYKPYDAVMNLIEIVKTIQAQFPLKFITEEFDSETVQHAWTILCEQLGISPEITSFRNCFLNGYFLLKQFEKIHGPYTFERWWCEEKKKNLEETLSIEQQLANKLARAFIRAAEAMRKSRQIRRLYNSTFVINATQKTLHLKNGEFTFSALKATRNATFSVSHYDRLSIVLSAKNRQLITLQ